MAKMTEQEKIEWDELYHYVKKDILNYEDDMKLPRFLILRLYGLKDGKFVANNKIQPLANYTFNEILMTFKINKITINNALSNSRKFKDEKHKINYVMAIIESKINDIAIRYRNIENSKEKGESIKVPINNNKADYIPKTKQNKNSLLDDLW